MKFGRLEIRASRWPWQRRTSTAMLEFEAKPGDKYGWLGSGTMGRFGGGWNWVLSISVSTSGVYFKLLFGCLDFVWVPKCNLCKKGMYKGERRGSFRMKMSPEFSWAGNPWDNHEVCLISYKALTQQTPIVDEKVPF